MKARLIGAAVLVALAVIFLPMVVKEPAPDSEIAGLSVNIPPAPDADAQNFHFPLESLDAPVVYALDGGAENRHDAPADTATTSPETPDAAAEEIALPPTAANGRYVVHFAAFATVDDANLTVQQLQAWQLPAFTEDVTLYGRPAVRVRVGPYATQAEAEIVRVQAAQVRNDVQPRVFMLIDEQAAERTLAALQPAAAADTRPAASAAVVAPEVGFVVQLGAFSNVTSATTLRDRLQQAGVAAFTDTVNTARGTLTRVHAGPVSSRAEADQLKARVKTLVEMDGVVRAHP